MNKRVIGVIAIVFITFLIYIPAMLGGFIWDDPSFLTENPIIKAGNGLYRFWLSTEPPDYFPLTSTTLWVEWRLWGMNAAGYHIINVLLHILSALLIWAILNRLKIPMAWLAALVFAVHPVNAEAVAWITQRKTTLPMVFYLASIFLYLRFEKTNCSRDYGLSLLSFLLALLSKTSVIMLPFVLLGCAWWQRGRIDRGDVRRSAPFFLVALILAVVTIWFQYNRSIGDDIVRTDSFLSRMAGAGAAVWFYLYKALWPRELIFVYPRWEIAAASVVSYLPGLALLALMFYVWRHRTTWGRGVLFGLGYFIVTLFPMLGFFNIYYMRYSLVADHYQYQSIIGIIALAVGCGYYVFKKLNANFRRWVVVAVAVVVGLLSLQTWTIGHIYKDPEALFLDTLAKNPDCWMANYNLGHFMQENGEDDRAIKYYEEAFRVDPANPDPLNNTGNIFLARGKKEDAIRYFNKAITIRPNFSESYYNMGCALQEMNRYPEAIDNFYKSLRINPRNERAHNNLANSLASQGRFSQAMAHYKEALKLKPWFVDAHVNMGIVLKKQKRYDEARKHFSEALRLQPDHQKARNNLRFIEALPASSAQKAPEESSVR